VAVDSIFVAGWWFDASPRDKPTSGASSSGTFGKMRTTALCAALGPAFGSSESNRVRYLVDASSVVRTEGTDGPVKGSRKEKRIEGRG